MSPESILRRRIFARVERQDRGFSSPCWVWQGAKNGGYGTIHIAGRGYVSTHRASYEAFVGPIPGGLVLDHLCRNPPCVHPAHLEPVTNVENIKRGEAGLKNRSKTHCPRGHQYNDDNTYTDKLGKRYCRPCNRMAATAYYDRKHRKKPRPETDKFEAAA